MLFLATIRRGCRRKANSNKSVTDMANADACAVALRPCLPATQPKPVRADPLEEDGRPVGMRRI